MVDVGKFAVTQEKKLHELLGQMENVKREVKVTSSFAAVTNRMKGVAGRSEPSLVSAASLTASVVAEPPSPAAIRMRTKNVAFQIISGNTDSLFEALNAGAVGIAPAFALAAPQAGSYEVYAAWKDHDRPLAEEKQIRLIEAARLAEATPGSLKYACDLNGYFGGIPRLPHLPPTGAERAELEQQMKPLRN